MINNWKDYVNIDIQELNKYNLNDIKNIAYSLNNIANLRLNTFRRFYEDNPNFPLSYRFRDIYRKNVAGLMENSTAFESGFVYKEKLKGKTAIQQRNILLNHIKILRNFLRGQQGTLTGWINQLIKDENIVRRQLGQPELPNYNPEIYKNKKDRRQYRETYLNEIKYFSNNEVVKSFWNAFNSIMNSNPQILAAIQREYGVGKSNSEAVKEEVSLALANGARTEIEILNMIKEKYTEDIIEDNKNMDFKNYVSFKTGKNK